MRDFAQKILPENNIESMKDYFGKRGISVQHIDAFIHHTSMKWDRPVQCTHY